MSSSVLAYEWGLIAAVTAPVIVTIGMIVLDAVRAMCKRSK